MNRFIETVPTATPGEALAMGIAIILGGIALFGLVLLLARWLARR
ncbi:hypothetical protein [Magnetospirillum sp. UT-4]|nr:hypothetical protein [Magnetospirillum sp. UT-4]CAA7623745.1 conserved hypothetical protein [Magnetospirillum sp. UT-4]